MLHRQNLEARGIDENAYHYLSVIKELHLVEKLENTVISTFARVLDRVGSIDDQNAGKSADVVLLHFLLVGVGVKDLHGGGTATRKSEWAGGEFLEFRGSLLAMTAPIRLANHNGRTCTRKSLISLTIQAKSNKEKYQYNKNTE
jgi:hypothetical protein